MRLFGEGFGDSLCQGDILWRLHSMAGILRFFIQHSCFKFAPMAYVRWACCFSIPLLYLLWFFSNAIKNNITSSLFTLSTEHFAKSSSTNLLTTLILPVWEAICKALYPSWKSTKIIENLRTFLNDRRQRDPLSLSSSPGVRNSYVTFSCPALLAYLFLFWTKILVN